MERSCRIFGENDLKPEGSEGDANTAEEDEEDESEYEPNVAAKEGR